MFLLERMEKYTHEEWSYELRIPLCGQGQLGHSNPCSASSADATDAKLRNPESPAPNNANALRDFIPTDPASP